MNNEEYSKNVNAPSHPQDLIWSKLRNEGEGLMLPVGFKMMGIYKIAINTIWGLPGTVIILHDKLTNCKNWILSLLYVHTVLGYMTRCY